MIQVPENKKIVLFDGVCNLCNSSIIYIIKHDKKDLFRFAPLQSEMGRKIIEHFKIDPKKTDSIVLYSKENGIAIKSSAALKIALNLGFPRSLMGVFFIIPTFIRNLVYDYIAKNRYKWYGKKKSCMIPTPELTSKFIK